VSFSQKRPRSGNNEHSSPRAPGEAVLPAAAPRTGRARFQLIETGFQILYLIYRT